MTQGLACTLALIALVASVTGAAPDDYLQTYRGTPFQDARHTAGRQTIPGRVQCALYDRGGEGVAYHDADPRNHGSGELNPPDGTYLNQFRMNEGVDISYTKFHRSPTPIDDNPFNAVTPPENQLYVGWTEPGEWFNVTVEVEQEGEYDSSFGR